MLTILCKYAQVHESLKSETDIQAISEKFHKQMSIK